MAVTYNRDQIRSALAEVDPSFSYYLDLTNGQVVRVHDTDPSPTQEALRNQVMEGYGDRYRYIPGGNPNASDDSVQSWLEAEGL